MAVPVHLHLLVVGALTEISPFRLGLTCRCPRCGEGRLYNGVLKVVDRCAVCDLELSKHDSGDGPAAFAIFFVGGLTLVLVAWMEFQFMPPMWVYALILPPLMLAGSIGIIRVFKAFLIASQYKHLPDEYDSRD